MKVVELKGVDKVDDSTLMMADLSEKSINQVKASVTTILIANGMDEDKADDLAKLLASPIREMEAARLVVRDPRLRMTRRGWRLADAVASLGILQSARGDSAMLPTLGPSGMQDRLNCWEKNLR